MDKGRSPLREPTGPWEFTLGALAILSLGVFLLPFMSGIGVTVPSFIDPYVIPVDIAICVVFAMDYLIRMGRSRKSPLAFARENFFQPFAMVPLNTPVVSNIDTLLILILAARFIRAFNVVFGQRAFQSVLHRYSGVLAREISDAVLVRSLATAREVATKGRFAKSIADALDRRRPELHMIVNESLEKVPAWDTVRRLPGAEEIVTKVEDLVVEALLETMRSERLNILVANIVDDSLEDFKIALEQQHPGITVDALGPDAEGHMPGDHPAYGFEQRRV